MFRRKKDQNLVAPETVISQDPISSPVFVREKIDFKLTDLEITTTLGTGTFGRVRLAKHISVDKFYALKVLKKSEVIKLKQLDHIRSEIKLLNMINHPFIVNFMGHFQDDIKLYMVLEYVQGGELFSYLRREGRISDEAAKFYSAEIVMAFAYLHSLNIAYRDLKPENLLIASNGHIKITDFGFAKVVEDRTWTLCGTPEYLAPEIIQSKGHGKHVDWWALGILIFELIAGYPPFYEENPFGIYQRILAGKIDFPRHMDSKAKDIVKRLLVADRTKRLGCMKLGVEDVKKHKWFGKMDWDSVITLKLPAPYIPIVSGPGDVHHYDNYPDSIESNSNCLSDDDKKAFEEFSTF